MKNTKKITVVGAIVLIAAIPIMSLAQTVDLGTQNIPQALGNKWYSGEEQNRINNNFAALVKQNADLQSQINQLKAGTGGASVAPSDTRIAQLETRVSTLESVVNLIKTNVMSVLISITDFLAKLK